MPLILFILPTLFIVLLGPAALGIIDTFSGNKGGPKKVTVVVHDGAQGDEMQDQTQITEVHVKDKPGHRRGSPASASVTPAATQGIVGQPMVVSVDARTLDQGFKLFVTIVLVGTPDTGSDPVLLSQTSEPVVVDQMQVTVVASEVGQNEIRLYALPSFGSPAQRRARLFQGASATGPPQ